MDTVFTTRGHLPATQIDLRPTVVEDSEDRVVVRTDKYDRTDGAWVGNDLAVTFKRLPSLQGELGSFA